uniref:Uncharacterized protein n=1 Tax=uncultured marine virus TaxID=186617 RepID=A0A0F7L4K5_9VIRU|nr:hypothetical protein [uncultured marine virus]
MLYIIFRSRGIRDFNIFTHTSLDTILLRRYLIITYCIKTIRSCLCRYTLTSTFD